jgi:hypothetical protein
MNDLKDRIRENPGLHGESGLWAAVLINILIDLESFDVKTRERARRIILEPENGCLPFIAAALGISTGKLHKHVIRYLRKKRITII